MAATATFNDATDILTVEADNLPTPVSYGTFPNSNNPHTVTAQDFDHAFIYRGGTFGISRTFDVNTWVQDGFIRSITLSLNDNALFGVGNQIQVGDRLMFVFNDGIKRVFLYMGTTFTSIAGECWLATDDRLDLIMEDQESLTSGTYSYYDQRNARSSTPLGTIGIAANGVALFNPSAGTGGNPPSGFSWNAHYEYSPVDFGDDNCGGHPEQNGQYHYHDGHFLDCWRDGSSMAGYNDYYGATQYNGDNLRHPDGHSKIIGYAFDGFPIYGPYGYDLPWDNLTGSRPMQSAYSTKSLEVAGRPDYGSTTTNPPAGALMQDWEYIEGGGDLDYHNGRFCITPEFQSGTYAYFLSVDSEDVDSPEFPYMVGLTTRETINTAFTLLPVQAPPSGGGGGGDGPVVPTLQFINQPQNATANVGETATFSVQARVLPEDGPIGYQWYRSTDGGFAFAAITGATTNSYTISTLAYMTGYRFRCRIIGPLGVSIQSSNSPLDSQAAVLTVAGSGGGSGSTSNRFDSTQGTLDSTAQTFDGT
jgi:hypothetical protein